MGSLEEKEMESEDLEMFFKNTNKRKNYIDPELKTNLNISQWDV